jgi:hypothetical protein
MHLRINPPALPMLAKPVSALPAGESGSSRKWDGRFWNTAEALKVRKPAVKLAGGGHKASYVWPELRVRARHMRAQGMLRHANLISLIR